MTPRALFAVRCLLLLGPILPLGTRVRVHVRSDADWHVGAVVLNDYGCLVVQYDGTQGGVARFPQVVAMERVDAKGRWTPVLMDSVRAADQSCGTVKHAE